MSLFRLCNGTVTATTRNNQFIYIIKTSMPSFLFCNGSVTATTRNNQFIYIIKTSMPSF